MSAAAPFGGCYEMRLGRWWPWAMGEDTKFVTPPGHIELQLKRGTEGFERNGLLIRTLPPSVGWTRGAYWRPSVSANDEAILVWTSGFSGVTMNLSKHGEELRGWAHAFFDFPRTPHVAHVTARKVGCTSAP